MTCKQCRSFAINHRLHGRDGSDPDLCDVCYWRKRAERKPLTEERIKTIAQNQTAAWTLTTFARAIEAAHGITGDKT